MGLRRSPLRRLDLLLIAAGLIVAACGVSVGDPNASDDTTVTAVAAVDGSTVSTSSTASAAGASSTTVPVVTVEPADDSGSSTASETTAAASTTDTSAATIASSSTSTSTATSTTGSSSTTATDGGGQPIPIRIRLDRRVDDAATEGFEAVVRSVLTDGRGWGRAGFEFAFTDDAADTGFEYTVVLAEGDEVDSLCLPYDTFGRFSCQIGPVVALNADRWRTAVDSWPVSLDEYRTMLVNHEVGHLLGQHHPAVRCPGDGQPAPVMAQQSSGVAPCTANPWPLDWEIVCARQGVEPLAPGFERNIQLTCGPDGPIN